MRSIRSGGVLLKQILGMDSYPVGVKFFFNINNIP
jgi:hypothetical protein